MARRFAQAAQRLLGRAQGQRRVAGDGAGQLHRAGLQGRMVRQHLGQQADLLHLLGLHQPCGKDEVHDPRRADHAGQPCVVHHGERVAQRARDREAEARIRRADPQVAHRGNGRAAPGAGAGDGSDRGLSTILDGGENPVDLALVGQGLLGGAELGELADVGAGGEGFLAGAGDDDGAHRIVVVRLGAELRQPLVHREGQRVARLRAVQRDADDAV
jgi:hypothetical protein